MVMEELSQHRRSFSRIGYAGVFSNQNGIGMPNYDKLAQAYDIPYRILRNHEDVRVKLDEILSMDGPVLD